ncbi:hypothetical protein CBR_g30512 [Chara braunii]|uniref:Uncharacterized protein n=1 Tax=Chara braunii TaxID=69332 RepID=A0A388LCX3_CHABU|nr:hypothetical protein CBR_g30512 [Chara braunii]|eukprot:GBG80144.1 hypothetical protein CBR_g30512 [Chara braunii]
MEPAIQSNVNGVETCAMETQDIVKGIAVVSNEGISAGANTTDCAVVLAAICEQTANMMTDGEASENDAGCVVADENVVRTSAGTLFPYDINWVPGRLQPGIVGGAPCFTFKVNGEWVPYPAPKATSWRGVTLSIIFDRVLRLNDEVSADDKSRHMLKLWHVLDAKGELRLNDFEYDGVDCGESWVIGGLDNAASSVCPQNDARRDPRWGWVPHDAPLLCGRVKVPMRDAIGNVWTTCYINGSFSSRHLKREVTEEEKMAMVCSTPAARCFSPPLRNPVELEVAEGKVFVGDHGYTYTHARGENANADGITTLVWNPFNLNPDVLAAIDIAVHVIPEGQLQQHVAPQKYRYRVNWVPGCLQPATVDGKVTMAAKLQTGHWLPLGWMHAGMVEQWQFLVVVARVSIFNADVKDHVLVREEVERQSLCIMSMSVAQVAKALTEVMKYAEEGFHYNSRGELSLLEERVSGYFAVSVDMRSTIMANGSGCVQARTLLERLRESPDVRVDSDAEDSPYSLKGVVQWMCSEGIHSGPQVEEEEEHDRSAPKKSDGAEDEESGNEGDDNDSSRRQSQDTDEDDDSDGKSASERTGEDQSAASERGGSPFPSRTLRREGERQARNGSDTEERVVRASGGAVQGPKDEGAAFAKKMKGKLLRSVAKAFEFSAANDATLYPIEDAFFAAVQATAKLAGETAEEGLRSHIAECGIRAVIGECNRMMTTIRGEITWQLKYWFWAEKGIPLVGSQQTDHHLPARNKMRTEMKENKTWRRSGDDPWGAPAFKTALLKVFQMRKEGRNLGVTLQQLGFAEMVIQCEIEQTTKTTRAAEQIEKLVSIKQTIVSSLRSRDTVMSFSVFKLDRSVSVAEKAATLFRSGTPSVHRPGPPSTTITDDDYDIEFILPQSTAAGDGDRCTDSLCAAP